MPGQCKESKTKAASKDVHFSFAFDDLAAQFEPVPLLQSGQKGVKSLQKQVKNTRCMTTEQTAKGAQIQTIQRFADRANFWNCKCFYRVNSIGVQSRRPNPLNPQVSRQNGGRLNGDRIDP
jgi:hypothetical protein